LKKILLGLLWLYQKTISPWLGSNCRFYPHCSEFGRQAINEYGVTKGSYLTLGRVLSCHPFRPGGYAPLKTHG